jgi:hypothetical protein
MPEQSRAADLPECSIVVNDLAGKAFYAQHGPGYEPRWVAAAGEPDLPSSTVDYEIKHGARVIRIGDWPAPSEMWPDARERLARHLWTADAGSPDRWDSFNLDDEARAPFYTEVDKILAVIAGRED